MIGLKKTLAFLTCLLSLGLTTSGYAANKWTIGFNEPFIQQYMLSKGLYCISNHVPGSGTHSNCPENTTPRSYSEIDSRLYDLSTNQHVGVFREILSVAQLRPEPGVNRFREAADIIDIYENYNLQVIFAFGITIPYWMSPGVENMWHPMPTSDAHWNTLKNNLSFAMGDFIKYLWDDPRISKSWIRDRLYIEGFNEFNDLKTGPNATPANSTSKSTIARLVGLEGGINWVLNSYGISVGQQLMPSLSADAGTLNTWLSDYYVNYNGQSKPNVHLYPRGATAATQISAIRDGMTQISSNPDIPPLLANKIVLGETGTYDVFPPICNGNYGLSIPERELLYKGIAADSTIASKTEAITFWRLMNLPESMNHGCEGTYGVVHQDNSGYKKIATDLFNYLNN